MTTSGEPISAGLRMCTVMNESIETLLLNLDEVAEHLRLSRRYVEQMAARGELVTVKIGGSVRVRRADLEDYVRSLPAAHRKGAA